MDNNRIKFMLKTIGLAALATGFVVACGIIIAGQYGLPDTPFILLSLVNAIAVIALSFFTYSYMKATQTMATEMKTSRDMDFELRHRPKVLVDFRISYSGIIYVEVTNEGNGAARNVRLSFDPELRSTRHGLADFPALGEGVSYLAPKKTLPFLFDSAEALLSSGLATDFSVLAEYEWDLEDKPKIVEKSQLHLSQYLRTDLSSYKDERTLVDEVEKIRKVLERR